MIPAGTLLTLLTVGLFASQKDSTHINDAAGGVEHEDNPITPDSLPESALKFSTLAWDYVAADWVLGHFIQGSMNLLTPVCGQPSELLLRIPGEINDPAHVSTDPRSCIGRA